MDVTRQTEDDFKPVQANSKIQIVAHLPLTSIKVPPSITADCVEKFCFSARSTNFLTVQIDQFLVARGSAKSAFRRSCASSSSLMNDPI
jgi:hypothetical protein